MKTLTVGIPTFNESANIKRLLQSLLDQQVSGFVLDRIIVSDDNSTDGTQKIVLGIKNDKILLLKNKNQGGIAKRLNQVFGNCKSDYLLILNGDVVVKDDTLLKKMVSISAKNKLDLLAGDLKEIASKNLISQSLLVARKAKDLIYESASDGDNWYTCHGPIRLFSKKLYSKLRLPFGVGEDMYSYYFCKKHGYKYGYTKTVSVYFKQPETLRDHIKQSTRFNDSQKLIEKEFGHDFVSSCKPEISISNVFKSCLYLLFHPVSTIIYFASLAFVIIKTTLVTKSDQSFDTWSIANSSKK